MTRSLAAIVDRIEENRFFGREVPASVLLSAAREIVSRQGLPGSYAGMFAPTGLDFRCGIRVFTGEAVRSGAATAHILGEECCRLLLKLGVKDRLVSAALARAEAEMLERLSSWDRLHAERTGFHCCGICTASFWRHLAAGGLDSPGPRFRNGMRVLASLRTGSGRWKRFPFFYTLLALTEIDLPGAREELRWAAPAAERSLKALRGAGRYAQRRRAVLERALVRAG
ncbi:MAG: hypothetical protein NTX53_20965 [candidate division WOR-3 bacterium]|nr:hypothetical protein [candidate division WOR-3 bacterium]